MDTPISHVNTRLYTLFRPEVDLGLLFATGAVSQIVLASGDRPIQFTLRHSGYAMRCKIAPGGEHEFRLAEGQQVRVTGNLGFSSQSAQFHLLVRELELLPDAGPDSQSAAVAMPEPLMGREAPRPREQGLSPAAALRELRDVPDWVYALAPLEVRGSGPGWGTRRVEDALQRGLVGLHPEDIVSSAASQLGENQELLSFLLEALDRCEYEDIELTAELLSQHMGESAAAPPQPAERRPAGSLQPYSAAASSAVWHARFWLWLAVLALLTGLALITLFFLSRSGGW